jgi:hypothetical protein
VSSRSPSSSLSTLKVVLIVRPFFSALSSSFLERIDFLQCVNLLCPCLSLSLRERSKQAFDILVSPSLVVSIHSVNKIRVQLREIKPAHLQVSSPLFRPCFRYRLLMPFVFRSTNSTSADPLGRLERLSPRPASRQSSPALSPSDDLPSSRPTPLPPPLRRWADRPSWFRPRRTSLLTSLFTSRLK